MDGTVGSVGYKINVELSRSGISETEAPEASLIYIENNQNVQSQCTQKQIMFDFIFFIFVSVVLYF